MTTVIHIDPQQVQPHDLQPAVDALRTGGVIIYPTDTIYGLGCDITNPQAVQRVQQLKDATQNKPCLLFALTYRMWFAMRAFPNTLDRCSNAVCRAPIPLSYPLRTVPQTYLPPRTSKPLDCAFQTIPFRWHWSTRSVHLF